MKKNLLNLLAMLAMVVAAGSLAVSCGDDNTDKPDNGQTEEPEDPNQGGQGGNQGGQEEYEFEIGSNPTANYGVPTPIPVKYREAVAASANGATIKVTGVSASTFVFEVTPGAGIQSYRLDCYPLAHLYNSLYEQMKSEGKSSITEAEAEQYIRNLVFNGTGSGGYTFSPDMHEDYACKTFDWAATSYSQFQVLPGAEYVIIAIGCLNADGSEGAEMTLCYINTPEEALVGNPGLEIEVLSSYVGWKVTYVDNEDCHYISNWETDRTDFEPYIAAYPKDIFIDWLRHTYQSGPQHIATWESNYGEDYYVQRNGFVGVDSTHEFMACAVAMDVNGTAAKDYESAIFTLLEKPETEAADCTLTIDPDFIGSQAFKYHWSMSKDCYAGVWMILTLDEYEQSYKNMSEDELKALAATIYSSGVGQNNYNYAWDKDLAEAIGDSWEGDYDFTGCRPGETYVLAYTGRNAIVEYMTTKFTEPFTMDTLVTDAPETCKSDLTGTFEAVGRNQLKIAFEYSEGTTSMIHWQIIEPFNETNAGYPSPGADGTYNDSQVANFLLETGTLGNFSGPSGANCNHFSALEGDSRVTTLSGFDSGTTYKIAYVAEDWDGVVGPVHYAETTTEGVSFNGNPVVTFEPTTIDADGSSYPSINVRINSDCQELKMMFGTVSTNELELRYLKAGRHDENHYLKLWYNYVYQYGLSFSSAPAVTSVADMLDGSVDQNYGTVQFGVLIAVPIGSDQNGNEVVGEMAYLIYDDASQSWKTISDFLK